MEANQELVLAPITLPSTTVPMVQDKAPVEIVRAPAWPPMPAAAFLLQQAWRHMPEPAYRQGLVWLAATDSALLVFAQLSGDFIGTSATEDHVHIWELGDAFEVFLHQAGTTAYFEFQIAPNGRSLQLSYPQLDSPRSGGIGTYIIRDRPLDSAIAIDRANRQWRVALKLPLDALPAVDLTKPSENWRIAFCRYDYAEDGNFCLTSSAPLTKPDFHRIHEWSAIQVPGGFVRPGAGPIPLHPSPCRHA